MRIAVISHLFPNTRGEADGVWVYRLARQCRKLGCDVRVINPAPIPASVLRLSTWRAALGEAMGTFSVRGAVHGDVPSLHPSHPYPWFLPHSLRHLPRRHVTGLAYRRWLDRDGFRPDLIHCVTSYNSGAAALPLAQRHGLPLVVTEISSPYALEILPVAKRNHAERVLRYSSKVVCISSFMEKTVVDAFPHVRGKTVVVYLPVSEEIMKVQRDRRGGQPVRLVTICFVSRQKGLDVMLDALSTLRRRGVRVHWTLGGDGPDLAALKERAGGLGLADDITFLGHVSSTRVGEVLAGCDAFVLPSRHETQAVALAEALAVGLPAVYTRCGGPEDYMSPACGVSVAPGDSLELADGISRLLDRLTTYDPDGIRRHAQALFAERSCAQRLVEVYEAALRS